jgi:hypothetical protein
MLSSILLKTSSAWDAVIPSSNFLRWMNFCSSAVMKPKECMPRTAPETTASCSIAASSSSAAARPITAAASCAPASVAWTAASLSRLHRSWWM